MAYCTFGARIYGVIGNQNIADTRLQSGMRRKKLCFRHSDIQICSDLAKPFALFLLEVSDLRLKAGIKIREFSKRYSALKL